MTVGSPLQKGTGWGSSEAVSTSIEVNASPRAPASSSRDVRQRWLLLSWFSLWPLIGYLELICPWDLLSALKNWYVVCLLFLASVILAYRMLQRYSRRPHAAHGLQNVTLLALTLAVTFLGADEIFTVYSSNARPRLNLNDLMTGREKDVRTWDGELMPHNYTPTTANFSVYKPGQIRAGETYGEHYYPGLLKHRVLREGVLQLRHVEYQIDKYGFRNIDPPSNSAIFALGDSFCFGYHMTQSSVFTSLLKSQLGAPVYNMGVSATAPDQQFLALDYSLRTYPDQFKPQHLLWLIFEGNDLEDRYVMKVVPDVRVQTIREKIWVPLAWMAHLPWSIRDQSIIRKLAEDVAIRKADQIN